MSRMIQEMYQSDREKLIQNELNWEGKQNYNSYLDGMKYN